MLAMVFGAVESRFSRLKEAAQEEANVIGTAYLRADLLPAAERPAVQRLLREYVSLRVVAEQAEDEQRVARALDRSEALQGELWSRAVESAAQAPTPVSALFVQSLNELIDVHEKRVTLAFRYRLPGIIWVVLYGLVILAMAMGGFDSGVSGSRRLIRLTNSVATRADASVAGQAARAGTATPQSLAAARRGRSQPWSSSSCCISVAST